MKTILLVDDDQDFRQIVATYLRNARYDVIEADCPDQAFQNLFEGKVDLAICDLHMPFTTNEEQEDYCESFEVGVRTIRELSWALPFLPIVAVSSVEQQKLEEITQGIGSLFSMSKPLKKNDLLNLVGKIFAFPACETMH